MPRIELETYLSKTTKVRVVADNPMEVIEHLGFFETLPKSCPRCGSDVYLTHREYDGNDFYEIKCRGEVQHKANIGQHKGKDTLFYKENQKWLTMDEIKQGYRHDSNSNQNRGGGNQPNNNYDDVRSMRQQANQGAQQKGAEPPSWLNEGPPPEDPRFR